MDEFEDPADLDGDGQFDAIDMMIMEDSEQEQKGSGKGNAGCCVVLLAIGSSASAGWWIVSKYLV